MSICLRCGKYPFCKGIEENKEQCNKFIKRRKESDIENDNSESR